MKIGILEDVHENPTHLRWAIDVLRSRGVGRTASGWKRSWRSVKMVGGTSVTRCFVLCSFRTQRAGDTFVTS
jgi:hypothetical protein